MRNSTVRCVELLIEKGAPHFSELQDFELIVWFKNQIVSELRDFTITYGCSISVWAPYPMQYTVNGVKFITPNPLAYRDSEGCSVLTHKCYLDDVLETSVDVFESFSESGHPLSIDRLTILK